MANLFKAKIAGTGYAVPERVLTNADLEKMVDTNDEWIRTRTGIQQRHIADPGQTNSELGAQAATMAMKNAGVAPEDIDLIIVATITPDMVFPATACLIQEKLGLTRAGTVDIEAACSGFIYGLSMARQYVATGECRHVLVVASELLSRITDWEDRTTCVLFGDGAGAAVVSGTNEGESDILATDLGGNGKFANLLYLPAGGSSKPASHETVDAREHAIKMAGQEVFKQAVTMMKQSVETVLQKSGHLGSELKMVIPHQANKRIIDTLRKYLDLPEQKVYVNVHNYGNTSAASIAIALAELVEAGGLERGDLVALCAFGGGLTWAAALFRY